MFLDKIVFATATILGYERLSHLKRSDQDKSRIQTIKQLCQSIEIILAGAAVARGATHLAGRLGQLQAIQRSLPPLNAYQLTAIAASLGGAVALVAAYALLKKPDNKPTPPAFTQLLPSGANRDPFPIPTAQTPPLHPLTKNEPLLTLDSSLLSNDVAAARSILSFNAFTKKELQKRLPECQTIEMVKLFIEFGVDINDPTTAYQLIDRCRYRAIHSSSKDLKLIEFYLEQGFRHEIFEIGDTSSLDTSIQLRGKNTPEECSKNILNTYLNYPLLTQQLHRFISTTLTEETVLFEEASLLQTQPTLIADNCLKFYCKVGDQEGVELLLKQISQNRRLLEHIQAKEQYKKAYTSAAHHHPKVLEVLELFFKAPPPVFAAPPPVSYNRRELYFNCQRAVEKVDLVAVRQILLLNVLTKREIQQYLHHCDSIEMAQLLIEFGADINCKDTASSLITQRYGHALNSGYVNLELIEFYLEQGFDQELFDKDYSSSMPVQLIEEGTLRKTNLFAYPLDAYLAYPHITQRLHARILSRVKQKKELTDGCLKFYCENGDSEGICSLFEQISKNNSLLKEIQLKSIDYLKVAVLHGHKSALQTLLSFFPLSHLAKEAQQELFSIACQFGSIEIEKLLEGHQCACSETDRSIFMSHKKWFEEGEAERCFPALAHYQSYDHSLNPQHLKLYGGEKVQDEYRKRHLHSLKFALWMMNESKTSDNFLLSFREFLTALGIQRKQTAYALHSPDARVFGNKRTQILAGIPTGGAYASYATRLKSTPLAQITIDGKSFVLKEAGSTYHAYAHFWKENDPLFAFEAALYKKVVKSEFKDKEELRKIIPPFHWLFALVLPFDRGGAAIVEIGVKAMQIFHSRVPPKVKGLDLEALCTSNMDEFSASYPIGEKLDI